MVFIAGALAVITPVSAAVPGPLCNVQYALAPLAAGGYVPASTQEVITFAPTNALVAGNRVVVTFPSGTAFTGVTAADFTIQQVMLASQGLGGCAAAGANAAAAPYTPAGVNPVSVTASGSAGATPTLDFTLAAANLSPTGLGMTWIGTTASAANKIRHPMTSTLSASLTVETKTSGGTTIDGPSSMSNIAISPLAAVPPSTAVVSVLGGGTTVSADGTSFATLTVTLLDAANNPAWGKTVSVAISGVAGASVTPASSGTNALGVASFQVRSTGVGTATLTVTDTTDGIAIVPSPSVTFVQRPFSIKFFSPPYDDAQGLPFATAVKVGFYDNLGNPYTTAPITVSLTLSPGTALPPVGSCPGGGRLVNGGGVLSANGNPLAATSLATGSVVFPALTVDKCGQRYVMTASGAGIVVNSQPFQVGKSSPTWNYGGNNARTGNAVGTADFSTRTSPAPIVMTPPTNINAAPSLIDLNGDGIQDIVFVNNGPAMKVMAYDGKTQTLLWSHPLQDFGGQVCASGNCVSEGTNEGDASLVAGYLDPLNPTTPLIVVGYWYAVDTPAASLSDNYIIAINGATGLDIAGSPQAYPYIANPFAYPAIGIVGGGGNPDVVVSYTTAAGGTALRGYKISGNTFSSTFDGAASSLYMGVGQIALADLRAGHADLEPVLVGGHFYVVNSWYDGFISLCYPSAAAPSCIEGLTTNDGSPSGVAIGDLNGDGLPEVVYNALSDPAQGPAIRNDLGIFKGTCPSLGPCTRLTRGAGTFPEGPEGDLMNSPALGEIDARGTMDIVNVQYGAPYPGQGTDRQANTGDVMVRSLDQVANPPAINDEGLIQRPLGESAGGGILLDVNHDVTSSIPDASSPPADADYRPEFVFGSADGNIVAMKVRGSTAAAPPTQLWAQAMAGVPTTPLAIGDLNGDCRPEIVTGMAGGQIGIVNGVAAALPQAPSFTAPTNFGLAASWNSAFPPYSPGNGRVAKLAWNAPSGANADGGLPVAEYRVYRNPGNADFAVSAANFIGVWPSGAPPTPSNPYVDATVPAAGDYSYKVSTVTCLTLQGGAGTTDFGVPSAGWFYAQVLAPPAAITGFAATIAEGGSPAYAGPVKVRLDWTASVAPAPPPPQAPPNGCGGNGLDGYHVYRDVFTVGSYIADIPSSTTSPAGLMFIDTPALAPPAGVVHTYKVAAYNCGGESAQVGQAVDVTFPGVATGMTITPSGAPAYASPLKVILRWTAPLSTACGIEGYAIYRSATPAALPTFLTYVMPDGSVASTWSKPNFRSAPTAATPIQYTDDGSVAGFPLTLSTSPYTYTVHAINCVGERVTETVGSNRGTIVLQVPDAPNLTAANYAATPSVTLTWAAPVNVYGCATTGPFTNGILGYQVWKGSTSGSETLYATVWSGGSDIAPHPLFTSSTPSQAQPWIATRPITSPISLAALPYHGAALLTYVDYNVVAGSTYYYTMTAINCVGQSVQSNERAAGALPITVTLAPGASSHTWANGFVAPSTWPTFTTTATVNNALNGANPPNTWPQCTWTVSPTGPTLTPQGTNGCGSVKFEDDHNVGSGVYTITVTAKDFRAPAANGVATATATVTVNARAGNRPPVASWSADKASGTIGANVAFSDSSTDPDTSVIFGLPPYNPDHIAAWDWDFGDGTTSSVPSPLHVFWHAGTYRVCLTVHDVLGALSTLCRSYTVDYPPAQPPVRPSTGAGSDGGSNAVPTAVAGQPQVVVEGTTVQLHGSANGVDPAHLAYSWTAPATISLSDNGAKADITFTAPMLTNETPIVLRFQLKVSDGSTTSLPDFVDITVISGNHPPVAVAKAMQQALPGDTVTLDGSASADPDAGSQLAYNWVQTEGAPVTITNADQSIATFVAPSSVGATLSFRLQVSDGRATGTDTARLSIVAPQAAPITFSALETQPGTVAFEANGTAAKFQWSFGDGTTATGASVTHTYPSGGTYAVQMVAIDANGASQQASQTIPVSSAQEKVRDSGTTTPAAGGFPWLWVSIGVAFVLAALAGVLLFVQRSRRTAK
jgi:PKD repeat protein